MHPTHALAVVVLCLMVLAAIVAPSAYNAAVDHLQAGCDAGTIDAGICLVAEIGGLVTPAAAEAQEVAP